MAALPPPTGLLRLSAVGLLWTACCTECVQSPLPASFSLRLPDPRGDKAPSSVNWIHEIKHDGFHMMVRRDAAGVRLLTRNGIDWTARFPLIAEAAAALRVKSFLIDGEAVCCDGEGMPVFDRLRSRRDDRHVFLYAFDLLQVDSRDLRREPIEDRKAESRQAATSCQARPAVERAYQRGRRHRIPARLQARLGRHRVEASWLALQVRALA